MTTSEATIEQVESKTEEFCGYEILPEQPFEGEGDYFAPGGRRDKSVQRHIAMEVITSHEGIGKVMAWCKENNVHFSGLSCEGHGYLFSAIYAITRHRYYPKENILQYRVRPVSERSFTVQQDWSASVLVGMGEKKTIEVSFERHR